MSIASSDKAEENKTLFSESASQDVGGASLRAIREAAGFDIAEIAAELRIPKAYLEALETEQHDLLPGETYGQGYIKSYCKFLKIDAGPYLDKFKMQMSRHGSRPVHHFPDEVLEPRMSGAMISMLLVLILLGGYLGWQMLDRFDLNPLTSQPTQIAQTNTNTASVSAADEASDGQGENTQLNQPENAPAEESAAVDTVIADVNESAPSIAEDTAQTQDEDISTQPVETAETAEDAEDVSGTAIDVAEVEAEAEENVAEISATQTETTQAEATQAESTQAGLAESSQQNANTASALATAREPADEIIISAIAPSWVEVVRENGDIVLNKLFKPGDQYVSPADTKLYLSTGNAGGLVLTLPGMSEFNVGQVGEIVRDLPLSRDSLRSRRSALINQ